MILEAFAYSNQPCVAWHGSFSGIHIDELGNLIVSEDTLVISVFLIIECDLNKCSVYFINNWRRDTISNGGTLNVSLSLNKSLGILIVVILSVCVLIEIKHAISVFGVIDFSVNEWLKISTLQCDVSASKPGTLRWNQFSDLRPIVVPIRDVAWGELLIVQRN